MRITVICVGKIKEKFYTDALAEYRKRLSKYCKLEIVELADEKTKENASAHEIELVKAKEGERILSAIKEDMYVIALAIEGKMLDSVELSEKIEKLGLSGSSHVAFVIGGSHSAFVDGFGRNQQPHDISSERFGEAEHQYSYQQEEHNPLNHYGTYITVASFSIASCNDNL